MRSANFPTVKSLNAISLGVAAAVFEMENTALLVNRSEDVIGAGDIPFKSEKVAPDTNCRDPLTAAVGFSVFSKENVNPETYCFAPAAAIDGFKTFEREYVGLAMYC